MTGKKINSRTDLAKLDAHVVTPKEYEEIPELNDEWFEKADLYHGTKLVQRGRPPSKDRKEAVSIRLSPDVLTHFRAGGPGWQTRIDAALRSIVRRSRRA